MSSYQKRTVGFLLLLGIVVLLLAYSVTPLKQMFEAIVPHSQSIKPSKVVSRLQSYKRIASEKVLLESIIRGLK